MLQPQGSTKNAFVAVILAIELGINPQEPQSLHPRWPDTRRQLRGRANDLAALQARGP